MSESDVRVLDNASGVHGEPSWTVVGHCSDDEGPPDVGLSLTLPDGAVLWAGAITRDSWLDAGEDAAALGGDFGSWLILFGADKKSSRVLGKFVNAEAAHDFIYTLAAAGLRQALATPPDADPVPELPEFVTQECDGHWTVHLKDGRRERIYGRSTPDDLDRIAEAARILAARERARREGGMSATRDEVRDAVAAAIYETFPRIQAPESPAPKWVDCKPRYRREWYRCADAALAAADAAGWQLVPKEEHKRLSDRVAALDEPYVDKRGEHWMAPTAFAYAAVCKALRTCKAERDAARAGAPRVTP